MSGRRNRPESRNVAAFNALLAPDEDEDPAPSSGSRRRRSNSSGRGRGRADRERPIQLREQQQQQEQEAGGLRQLQDLFGEAFPLDVITDVFNACSSSEEAIDALLSLSGAAGAGSTALRHTQSATPASSAATAPSQPCYWDWLPEECKLLVLGRLSVRDLARAAGACSELARHVRQQRQRMRTVMLPEGISMRAVRGAVAAFSCAPAVCFSRWAPHLRFPHQFEDIFDAVALGGCDRASGVPVRHADLSRCGGLTDGDVGMLCSRLRHLESIDLSGCTQVSDDSLGPLSRYTSEPADASSSSAASLAADLAAGLELVGDDGGEQEGSGGSGSIGGSGTAQLSSPRAAVKRIAAAKEAARQVALEAAATRAALPAGGGGGLKQLRLRDTGVTTSGLRALLQGSGAGAGAAASKSLLLLDVSSCRGIGPEGFDLGPRSALCTLRATGCLRLRSVVLQLPHGTLLEELDLSSCRQLHEVALVAPQLRRLTLSHCGVLVSLALRCRALEELRCVNCSRLPALGPEFECPSLRHLDLFGCRLLDSEGLEAAAASFERLEWLNLGGCTSLSRLVLAEQAPRLVTANITGCCAVRQVVLGSSMLKSLTAKACERLLEVRLHTMALQELDLENCSSLREVALPAQPNSPRSTAAGDQEGRLVLKGCAALAPAARRQLSSALRHF